VGTGFETCWREYFFPTATHPPVALRSSSRASSARSPRLYPLRATEARIPRRVPSHSIAFRRANSTVEHRSSPFCRAIRPSLPRPRAPESGVASRHVLAILLHRRKYEGRVFMTNDDGIFLHVDHARKTRGLLRDAVKLRFNIFRANTRQGYYNSGGDQRCSRPRSD